MKCKICSSETDFFSEAEILFKYKIKYYNCPNCGFVQTEAPYWLEEAYSSAINHSDIGLLKRNLDYTKAAKNALSRYFKTDSNFVDYGAGYGVFVRMMRDFGYRFFWSDKYCENLFAAEFESDKSGIEKFDALTAFEVFEHLENPVIEVEEMLKFSDNIFFSTFLFPETKPKPDEWWYYALDHGQHLSLYSRKSLEVLAAKFNKNFYTNGKNVHIFTNRKMNGFIFKIITYPLIANFFNLFITRKSLLDSDYKLVLEKLKKSNS